MYTDHYRNVWAKNSVKTIRNHLMGMKELYKGNLEVETTVEMTEALIDGLDEFLQKEGEKK